MPAVSGEEAVKLAQKLWERVIGNNGFEALFQKVKIVGAGNGGCSAEFTVERSMTNPMENLHGGCTAALVDCISTLGLMTTGDQKAGVSVNMNVSYQNPANMGQVVRIDSRTVKCGKKLAHLDIVFTEKESGKVIATGTHVKYVGS